MSSIIWEVNRFKNEVGVRAASADHDTDEMKKAESFHKSMPGYDRTPLAELKNLSDVLGLGSIYVKDESERFGLNAFKGLGASYAMAKYFAGRLDIELADFTFDELLGRIPGHPPVIFSTATDGNHGKGVAWASELFKQKSRVYMPEGTADSRLDAVLEYGAGGAVTEMNYEDTVEYVREISRKNGWVHIQDTSWEGYTELPMYIMQGYMTIIAEIEGQLQGRRLSGVSHIILQAGVGSFAGAMAAAVYNLTDGRPPHIIVVEPQRADCLHRSAKSEDGRPVRVHGSLDSMMAGLSCGAPNPADWEILKSVADGFASCADSISATGMRILGNPAGEDSKVISGESGALPLGFLYEVMTNEEYGNLKEELGLDAGSSVLTISTEGDTDPVNYRSVVWGERTGTDKMDGGKYMTEIKGE
ncbi:diaminopropionate ammonia-lyase [Salinicoccus carnicancri]|uniref:diaminopropionate ammonia-lyase n=1 Tax=Salinicoccus carnicancri TaxID=558170 RepID=UPI00031AF58B|nr:diaminopropionate ammonia-lyase [Salinicoccus carnicancri]